MKVFTVDNFDNYNIIVGQDQEINVYCVWKPILKLTPLMVTINLQVNTSKGTNSSEEEPENPAAAAKGKVVSAMMKKHLMEGIVPVMVELKRLLEAKRHPLMTQLMLTMRVLLKDHKSEVPHVL